MYWIKTPWWLPKLYSSKFLWKVKADPATPTVYLTFDDGPHDIATPFVLDQLRQHDARATFFCIGKNVAAYPEIFERTLAEGHAVGNHTQHHLNGWKTPADEYINDIITAYKYIESHLFRPPYGRIKRAQASMLMESGQPWRICMWDVLSADFDVTISPEQCLDNVLKHISPGAIVVFHDSAKAWDRMRYALPRVLNHCREQGWKIEGLNG